MFINELAEPTLLVIYPGRFQPFHKGHHAVYEHLATKFGRNNVYIATSNKTDTNKSPFTFAEKAYFMQLTGVPADRIIQTTQPYQIESILSTGQVTVADPTNTVVIFAVSQKDMDEDPRFSFAAKKDGSAPYFQPLRNLEDTVSMNQHGYIMTVPTFNFNVLGKPMRSATELRAEYKEADEKTRQAIVTDLFGKYTQEAEQIMNSKIPAQAAEPVNEMDRRGFLKAAGVGLASAATGGLIYNVAKKGAEDDKVFRHYVTDPKDIKHYEELQSNYNMYVSLSTTNKAYAIMSTHAAAEIDTFVKQMQKKYNFSLKTVNEMGGTGVVASKKQARDPRYSTSLTKDVRPGQINKSLKAFNLAEEQKEFQYNVRCDKYDKGNFVDKDDAIASAQKMIYGGEKEYTHIEVRDLKNKEIIWRWDGKKEFREMREPYQQAIDRLSQSQIAQLNSLIDEITHRINTEKLPAHYVEALKQRMEKLKAERTNIALGR